MNREIKLIRLSTSEEEIEVLQRVLEAAPDYYKRVTGAIAERNAAERLVAALPEGKTLNDKFLYGIYYGDELIGCADVFPGFPDENTALLGLLLLSEKFHRKDFGKTAFQIIEQEIIKWGCKRIWLSVLKVNDLVMPFWKKMGFHPTGETRPYSRNNIVSESILMDKKL